MVCMARVMFDGLCDVIDGARCAGGYCRTLPWGQGDSQEHARPLRLQAVSGSLLNLGGVGV